MSSDWTPERIALAKELCGADCGDHTAAIAFRRELSSALAEIEHLQARDQRRERLLSEAALRLANAAHKEDREFSDRIRAELEGKPMTAEEKRVAYDTDPRTQAISDRYDRFYDGENAATAICDIIEHLEERIETLENTVRLLGEERERLLHGDSDARAANQSRQARDA